jgi:hypothetical protein
MVGKRPIPDVRTNPYPSIPDQSYEIHANNQSMFRASPWVPYDPSTAHHQMDEDVDMDAPQISILKDEASPPPATSSQSSPSKKIKKARKEPPTWARPRPQGSHTDDEYDEVEEQEEDQLIDDEDTKIPAPPSISASVSGRSAEPKKKAPAKRKPKESKKDKNNGTPQSLLWQEEDGKGTPSNLGDASDMSKPATPVKVPKKPGPKPKKEKQPANAK